MNLAEAAARLREATRTRVPIEPLTVTYPDLTVDDAWRIQAINIDLLRHDGRVINGYKVGLTSAAMQQQMGVDEPDFGVLLDHMLLPGVMVADEFVQPRIEAEIALVLGADLPADATAADVLAATAQVFPSIEIIDSRVANWKLSLVDTVADNASSGAYVLGPASPLTGLDLAAVEVTVTVNGEVVDRGLGAAALGHPADAAAWLARRLAGFGQTLTAGSVVMTGSLHASLPVTRGDRVAASFTDLGDVTLDVR
ncbi:fumarylacetoacetate hydrolase family protein [Dactylosporangium fulvum]|uniref:Fumarylacetoacetate hydrolase family protein n=1 Tax=Dactylosporangium fulvum TaxID=53359 RepID=A0ABY5VQL8_9ACTN|nr:fumarylacetoacetate hydrolase family protein [Dactylosporangium fulvum]UWP80072.1 fumarylacetoacetate hydrolase family protein [Dactylosporangium fulvum]